MFTEGVLNVRLVQRKRQRSAAADCVRFRKIQILSGQFGGNSSPFTEHSARQDPQAPVQSHGSLLGRPQHVQSFRASRFSIVRSRLADQDFSAGTRRSAGHFLRYDQVDETTARRAHKLCLWRDWNRNQNLILNLSGSLFKPEIWYQLFIWSFTSSLILYLIAAGYAFKSLRKHKIARFWPIVILFAGLVNSLIFYLITSASIAAIYR